jgi:hypothetical protein
MRDQSYLENRLNTIWAKYFADSERPNEIVIRFGQKAGRRLGSIRRCEVKNDQDFKSLILINGYFRDEFIPEYVIDATIAHELVHYIHGFSSPLPRLSRFPHRGGRVDWEMSARGIKTLERKENAWLNKHWLDYLE